MFKNLKIYNLNLYTQILQNNKNLKTMNRNTIILPEFVDKIIYVSNGLVFKKIKITSNMVGTKLGQYVFTRKFCKHKVKKIKKKK